MHAAPELGSFQNTPANTNGLGQGADTMGRHNRTAANRVHIDVPRQPNGQPSRGKRARAIKAELDLQRVAKEEQEMMAPNIDARMRIFGIGAKMARDQLSGSFMGRLALMGQSGGGISRVQCDAGLVWLEDKQNYLRAIQAPPDASAMDLAHTPGVSHAESVKWYKKCVARHNDARQAIYDAQQAVGNTSNLWAALDLIVEKDEQMTHMVGDLRELLNALGRHYGIIPKLNKKRD